MSQKDKQIVIPLEDLITVDTTEQNVEKQARGFILGSQTFAKQKQLRQKLEEKVTKRIGTKGKYLVDKLFELIEGVYLVEKHKHPTKVRGVEVRYYKVPPSLQAIIYALDRVLGKPKQVSEHTEEKKGLIIVENIIRTLATSEPATKNDDKRFEDKLIREGEYRETFGEGKSREDTTVGERVNT